MNICLSFINDAQPRMLAAVNASKKYFIFIWLAFFKKRLLVLS